MIKRDDKYKFYNPDDTAYILKKVILKEGKYEFNLRKNKEQRKNWWFTNKADFFINPALLFVKLIPYGIKIKNNKKEAEKENKEKYLNLVISEFGRLQENSQLLESTQKRIEQTITALEKQGFKKEIFETVCAWRMVIGLGASHPQETSMTLHHIYGIPYIPGSAVKGVTRHWIILSEFENNEEKAEENEEFKKTFGTQNEQGKVIFMDAFPVGKVTLKIDIMNPHYPDYYSGSRPPADWQTPNPIKFLTVENTKFKFVLLSREEKPLQTAASWLKKALEEFGIGAKTSCGYGIFVFNRK